MPSSAFSDKKRNFNADIVPFPQNWRASRDELPIRKTNSDSSESVSAEIFNADALKECARRETRQNQ